MEVHHHSHHGKKKWTEYFWEFLMLFLAVFAGFLAENQREHYVEDQRAKALAKNLYKKYMLTRSLFSKKLLSEIQKKESVLTLSGMSKTAA